jgi:RHS repeat-associated protein
MSSEIGPVLKSSAYGNPVELLVTQNILSSGPLYTGKEFDSRTRTYYFGARFFDADLGVWLTPDPAGQFLNPYSFGGSPVNGVDPDGRCIDGISTALCIGAVIGAYMGAVEATDSYTLDGFKFSEDWDEVLVGGITGAVTAYVAPAASFYATGSVGLGTGSGAMAAMAGSSTYGAIAGGLNNFSQSTLSMINGRGTIKDIMYNTFTGSGQGAIIGGVLGGFGYEFSSRSQWNTHDDVISYANEMGKRQEALEYVAKQVGANPDHIFYEPAFSTVIKGNEVLAIDGAYLTEQVQIGPNTYMPGDILISSNGFEDMAGNFDASNVYETVLHENTHRLHAQSGNPMSKIIEPPTMKYIYEAQVYRELRRSEYMSYWSIEVQGRLNANYTSLQYKGYYEYLNANGIY